MEQIPNWFYRTSAKALILNNEKKFLLAREEKWWELPWWGLEFWEKPQEGIKRELAEEMEIIVKDVKENPSYFLTAQKKNWIWIANIIYGTTIDLNDLLNFKPSDECLEVKFFDVEQAKKEELFPNVQEFIKIFDPNNH
jgi:ADP-ribose pyrophosphatase YjhB (NUDIX family)